MAYSGQVCLGRILWASSVWDNCTDRYGFCLPAHFELIQTCLILAYRFMPNLFSFVMVLALK